jgi:hypothetical protein
VAQPQAEHARRVVGYCRSPESRLAYRLLLGGTKHFGYYPEGGGRLSMTAAMRRMEDKLGQTLALPPGARGLAGSPRCRRLDYGELAFPDALFDGAYTMETLARAFDHRRALRELRLRGRAVAMRSLPAAGRLLRARTAVLNSMALVEGYRHREGWRYNVVRARRPVT